MLGFRFTRYYKDQLAPGMVLGHDVLSDTRQVLLGSGTMLTEEFISRLNAWSVEWLMIREEADPLTVAVFREYSAAVDAVRQAFETVQHRKTVPLDELKEVVDKYIGCLAEARGILTCLQAMRVIDQYTFQHSVNVAIIAGVLGKWLTFKGKRLKELMIAGLLHDIGKTQIPLDILNKPGRLTAAEMDTMKLHTTFGYELLRAVPDIPETVFAGVLQHHERTDGSGYPAQLSGENIHLAGKVIAIADIYDAMTSDRVYRKGINPFAVLETIIADMFGKLDPGICTTFLKNVRDNFIGSVVRLSDGSVAEVIGMSSLHATKPIVKTVTGEFINLEKNKRISIAEILKT
jgi:putative nucleotidyltransferase with HDIG domain